VVVAPLTLLCVHPHPDDEAIACGGVLARYSDEGATTHVVTCTGGEAGENLGGIDLGGDDLPWHRRQEMAAAIRALGVSGHTWLGFRDSGMAGTPENQHPDAFAGADVEVAAARLARIVRELRPHVVVSDDDKGTYGHPDHVQAHRVTNRALELAADPGWEPELDPWEVPKRYVHALSRSRVFALHNALRDAGLASPFGDGEIASPADMPFGADDDVITTRVAVADWLDRKQDAMRAHRSQIAEDSFFFNIPDEIALRWGGHEEFVLLGGSLAPGPDGLEDDLFAGLRG
jgi:N-acetyl-1-D-myo-inositol-2-amino-2-deoxy-alpha-D-glucopyranoside deacetylase